MSKTAKVYRALYPVTNFIKIVTKAELPSSHLTYKSHQCLLVR